MNLGSGPPINGEALNQAGNTAVDYRELVREGYDRCAEAYAAARSGDDEDQLRPLLEILPAGTNVLDLGCGAGIPITRGLARLHDVTCVDASAKMLEMAREAVPAARFVQGDILAVDFEPDSFDAITSIHVLFHLPREEHGAVFAQVWKWLRPGGYFLATLSEEAEAPCTDDDFFGTRMYWSSLGYGEYEKLLLDLGFEITAGRIIGRGYGRAMEIRDERHPMILVRKPPVKAIRGVRAARNEP
jgi:SAM-dependent methyltransferase